MSHGKINMLCASGLFVAVEMFHCYYINVYLLLWLVDRYTAKKELRNSPNFRDNTAQLPFWRI